MNYYKILGVGIDATPNEIRTAFRRVSRETHPDLHKDDPEKEAQFKDAQQAYAVLSDKELREEYDRTATPPETVTDLLLRSKAGRTAVNLFLPKAPAEAACGEDIIIKAFVARKDLRKGTSITVQHGDQELIATVPPSSANSIIARFAGHGKPGRQGGNNGDLLIVVVAK